MDVCRKKSFLSFNSKRSTILASCSRNDNITFFLLCFFLIACRRQTAEEREAERQAASRLIMSLHNEVISKGLYGPTQASMDREAAPSFNALQGLQSWASTSPVGLQVQPGSEHHSSQPTHYSISTQPPIASPIC